LVNNLNPLETSNEETSDFELTRNMTTEQMQSFRTLTRLEVNRQNDMDAEAKQARDDQQTTIFNNKQRQARYNKRTRRRADRWSDIHLLNERKWQNERITPDQRQDRADEQQTQAVEEEARYQQSRIDDQNKHYDRLRLMEIEEDYWKEIRNARVQAEQQQQQQQQQEQRQQQHIESQLTTTQYNEYLANRGDSDEKKQERDKQNNKRQKRAQERKG
jgi:hypothetical protein